MPYLKIKLHELWFDLYQSPNTVLDTAATAATSILTMLYSFPALGKRISSCYIYRLIT
jgi:hypothetical protein